MSVTKVKVPRQYSLVRYLPHKDRKGCYAAANEYVFLGEIPNRPGFCAVAWTGSGKVSAPLRIEDFEEIEL